MAENYNQVIDLLRSSGYFKSRAPLEQELLGSLQTGNPHPLLQQLSVSGQGNEPRWLTGRTGKGNFIDSASSGIFGPAGERLIPNVKEAPPGPIGEGPGMWTFDGWGNLWRNDWVPTGDPNDPWDISGET